MEYDMKLNKSNFVTSHCDYTDNLFMSLENMPDNFSDKCASRNV